MAKFSKFISDFSRLTSKTIYEGTGSLEIDADLELVSLGKINKAQAAQLATAKLAQAMPMIEGSLRSALNAAMESNSWAWTEGGARDIVDTGRLKNSLSIQWQGLTAIVSYSEPYAALIHEGGYIHPYGNMSAQRVYVPARPWVRSVLMGGGPVPRFNWEAALKTYFGN